MSVIAVIPAAGIGKRMCADVAKQYLQIGGEPILAHTLRAFDRCAAIDEIIVVVPETDLDFCLEEIVEKYEIAKVSKAVAGGERRQDSVYNGLMAIEDGCEIVLVHDGARPFVTEQMIVESIEKARKNGAACTAVLVKDTIKSVDQDGLISETLPRETLYAAQTPQTFSFALLLAAHEQALLTGADVTDDSSMVEALGRPVAIVQGAYENIKITTPSDLAVAEQILVKRNS